MSQRIWTPRSKAASGFADPFSRIWTLTKTLLLPNSGSTTINYYESTRQFTFWNGDIHCLSFRAMQKEGSYFLSQSRSAEIFHKRSSRGKSVVFRKPLFLCLDEKKKNFLFSFSAACVSCFLCFLTFTRPVRRGSKSARGDQEREREREREIISRQVGPVSRDLDKLTSSLLFNIRRHWFLCRDKHNLFYVFSLPSNKKRFSLLYSLLGNRTAASKKPKRLSHCGSALRQK